MPDSDLERRGGGGGLPKKIFSALRASVWSKNKEGPGPLRWIRHFNGSNLTDFRTCTEGKSHGSLYMPLSLPQGPLFVAGRLGERKRKRGGHDVLLYLLGYPAGASAEERGSAMYRFHSNKIHSYWWHTPNLVAHMLKRVQ